YFGFLLRFLVLPIVLLLLIAWVDGRRGRLLPAAFRAFPAWAAILLHVVIAVVYTTPWDNYLVATRVWWYDPAKVTGIVLGWVPIEEYTFFALQPILAGLWLLFLLRRLPLPAAGPLQPTWRRWPLVVLGVLWGVAVVILAAGWRPGTYLALELVWALPPIMLQIAFGGDILARYGRLVLTALLSLVFYLAATDAVAIRAGVWTIDPAQSLPLLIGGVLPVEEFLFFTLTCTLLAFGIVLVMAGESHERFQAIRRRVRARLGREQGHASPPLP
ncbi:MAG: lycopene cyclase domain-containing protein, partial [Caldilineales bacterium]|nr:lycopene cyclase domain-containing protein [Caldilineales bacterium]